MSEDYGLGSVQLVAGWRESPVSQAIRFGDLVVVDESVLSAEPELCGLFVASAER